MDPNLSMEIPNKVRERRRSGHEGADTALDVGQGRDDTWNFRRDAVALDAEGGVSNPLPESPARGIPSISSVAPNCIRDSHDSVADEKTDKDVAAASRGRLCTGQCTLGTEMEDIEVRLARLAADEPGE